MRQAALTVAFVFLFTGVSAIAEAQAPKDPKQLEQNCNAGDLKACVTLGEFYRVRGIQGTKEDRTLAISLFERACNGGNPQGCYWLGFQFASGGQPTELDKARGVQFYQKACDMKHGPACYQLGFAYERGEGVGQDYKQASALHEQACDLGDSSGCRGVARLADPKSNMLPDVKRWATFMEKECDLGSWGADTCLALGLHYDLGLLVPKDPKHANELFKKACLFGNKEACKLIVRK